MIITATVPKLDASYAVLNFARGHESVYAKDIVLYSSMFKDASTELGRAVAEASNRADKPAGIADALAAAADIARVSGARAADAVRIPRNTALLDEVDRLFPPKTPTQRPYVDTRHDAIKLQQAIDAVMALSI